MAKKTKSAKKAGSSVRLTRQQVLDGVPGPDGVRIAFAVAEEASTVTALLKAAADDLETGHLEALAQGRCGTWLLDALEGADLGEPLVRATAAGELQAAAAELSLPLMARDGDGQVIGALSGVPSGTVASGLSRLPASRQQVLMSMLTYTKIKAVAVPEDARGREIGAALLKRCVQLYGQLEYTLLFGEFDTGRDLGPYYMRQGFTVLRPAPRPTGPAVRPPPRRPPQPACLRNRHVPLRPPHPGRRRRRRRRPRGPARPGRPTRAAAAPTRPGGPRTDREADVRRRRPLGEDPPPCRAVRTR